ncbi:MAG: DUF4910 domain-containing protein [Tannerellaceae bacterium]|nr:DUF4910 domain-containing protein [Tannerellaceae bacterium]
MIELARRLYPICRSITGKGVRDTLHMLKEEYQELQLCEIPSGTKVFDWTVPKEWNIKDAYIENDDGSKIVDFQQNNLHVVGYSLSMNVYLTWEELQPYLYSLPEQPDAIPYVTSYYKERSGFCITENQRREMSKIKGKFHCVVDSTLEDGVLNYGEIILPGETDKEILLSTYICHPSMVNNELSGPVVTIELAKWLKSLENRHYTYRILFIPETIGSIAYLSLHKDELKDKMVAGFVLSCVGDERTYSYVESRYGDTLTDKVIQNVLKFHYPDYKKYSFLQRGSDERQYNAPGIDLPVCSICRSKYGEYPEYHTSLDNFDLVTENGLQGTLSLMKKIILALEHNRKYKITCFCEPQLGKRGLYPTVSRKGSSNSVRALTNFIAYADGRNDLIDISNMIAEPIDDLIPIVKNLMKAGLIETEEDA